MKAWALLGSLASSQEVLLIHLQAPALPFQVPKNPPSLTSSLSFSLSHPNSYSLVAGFLNLSTVAVQAG